MALVNIPNNILKNLLTNVVFVIGTNCGGKTTMAKTLAMHHNKTFYSADEHYWNHRPLSDATHQPNMNRPFITWEEYFSRDPKDQAEWLYACEVEEMPFILLDLVRLTDQNPKGVVADVHCVPEAILHVSDPSRIVAMTATEAVIRKEYFARDDKNPVLECIRRETKEPEKAKANVEATAVHIARIERDAINAAEIFVDERSEKTDYDARLARVETHLGWRMSND